ncbi:MAG TPA: carbohydrate kinase, partial [Kiloniellaceae bacterium]|nr:carbohydrate kinase [Kiloniellaceae bacterium]
MTRDLLIGVDAGTSVIKAVAFDLTGGQVAMTSRRNHYLTLPNGGVEQDMRRTWQDTVDVLRDLGEQVEGLGERALALSVTGQGDGCWLIDAEGVPIHDGWLWLDARAAAEAREIAESAGIDVIYRTTGSGVNVCQMRTHLTWIKRHEPELLERAETAMHCKDWLYFNLTGKRAADPTEAVFTFGDYRTRAYAEEVLEALGLADLRRLLPPIVDGAAEAHGLAAAAA